MRAETTTRTEATPVAGTATAGARRLPIGLVRIGALGIGLLALTFAGVEFALIAVTLDDPAPEQWAFRGAEAIGALPFGVVGALVAFRRPSLRLGWLLGILGLLETAQGAAAQYPIAAWRGLVPSELAQPMAWFSAWAWAPALGGLAIFLPLLFPDGHLPSRRWLPLGAFSVAAIAYLTAVLGLSMEPIGRIPATTNNARILSAIGLPAMLAYLFLMVGAAGAAISLVRRYRASVGVARQQIKWMALAGALMAVGVVGALSPLRLGQMLTIATALFAAVALGMAILRYRLYEIDLIINRTLVYGTLSAVLAGIYTASITLSQRVFIAVTGERSDAAIVVTTLIVVSMFTPLKNRLQSLVDRRVRVSGAPAATPGASVTQAELKAAIDELRAELGGARVTELARVADLD